MPSPQSRSSAVIVASGKITLTAGTLITSQRTECARCNTECIVQLTPAEGTFATLVADVDVYATPGAGYFDINFESSTIVGTESFYYAILDPAEQG